MRLPDEINLLGLDFEVSVDDDIGRETQYYGVISHDRQTIKIDSKALPQKKLETFLHEIIHGIEAYLELKLDERQVSLLSKGLYSTINANDLDFRFKEGDK